MKIRDKIRSLRLIKGFSQENMADLLGISSIAYGDIERSKTDVTHSRLEKIAKALGKNLIELLTHGEQVANIFTNCSNNHVVGNGNIVYSEKELRHELDKAQLREAKLQAENEKLQFELRLCQAEKEKVEIEAKYLREKAGE
jgi:XRE family transcriptional regulator, regulator of sulfur utilization